MGKLLASLFFILVSFAQPAFAEPACGDFKSVEGPIFLSGFYKCMCKIHYKQDLKPGALGGPFIYNVLASPDKTCSATECASAIALAKKECLK